MAEMMDEQPGQANPVNRPNRMEAPQRLAGILLLVAGGQYWLWHAAHAVPAQSPTGSAVGLILLAAGWEWWLSGRFVKFTALLRGLIAAIQPTGSKADQKMERGKIRPQAADHMKPASQPDLQRKVVDSRASFRYFARVLHLRRAIRRVLRRSAFSLILILGGVAIGTWLLATAANIYPPVSPPTAAFIFILAAALIAWLHD